jgi:hypothetical protein
MRAQEVHVRFAGAMLVGALLAGCALFPSVGGQVTIPASQDAAALPVAIVDHGGIVREAGLAARLDGVISRGVSVRCRVARTRCC